MTNPNTQMDCNSLKDQPHQDTGLWTREVSVRAMGHKQSSLSAVQGAPVGACAHGCEKVDSITGGKEQSEDCELYAGCDARMSSM